MTEYREPDNNQHNSVYYNQMMKASSNKKKPISSQEKEFTSKAVDFKKYLKAPEGFESIFYALYFIVIPYIVGIMFLFLYVAKGAYTNFALLDITSFLIIWAIGYEIMGAFILLLIFFSFLRYLKPSK